MLQISPLEAGKSLGKYQNSPVKLCILLLINKYTPYNSSKTLAGIKIAYTSNLCRTTLT